MKLKLIVVIALLYIPFITQCSEPHAITVRPATLNDLENINNLTSELYRTHFKPIFSHFIPEHDLAHFVNEKIIFQQNANKDFINKQLNQEEYGLIIAEETTTNQIVGYSRFFKKHQDNVHICLLGVNESFRGKKIGTDLLHATINAFDGVTHCTLRTLAHNNDTAHAFYQKNGFQHKGFISLDLITGALLTDPTAPITHAEYCLEVKN